MRQPAGRFGSPMDTHPLQTAYDTDDAAPQPRRQTSGDDPPSPPADVKSRDDHGRYGEEGIEQPHVCREREAPPTGIGHNPLFPPRQAVLQKPLDLFTRRLVSAGRRRRGCRQRKKLGTGSIGEIDLVRRAWLDVGSCGSGYGVRDACCDGGICLSKTGVFSRVGLQPQHEAEVLHTVLGLEKLVNMCA